MEEEHKPLHISMQFFGESEQSEGDSAGTETAEGTESSQSQDAQETPVHSEEDYAALQAELDALRAEKLTQEERTRLELTQRETDIANREAALRDKENRLHAVHSLESAGLCGNGVTTDDLMPFVLESTAEKIDSKVKSLQGIFDKLAKAQTEKIYHNAGRQPQQVQGGADGTPVPKTFNSALIQAQSRAKEIREKYTGGNK
jgi:hypothetical protein